MKQKDTIMVSVLMFVYNHEKYLKKAIESVLCQKTDFLFEVIIHDDASTDGSQSIIKEYAGKYPHIIVPVLQTENQMQKGVSIVDNFVMPLVRGKYIAYCEGDDYWLSRKKLQLQADFLEKNTKYAGMAHNCAVVDEDGNLRKAVRKFYPYSRPYIYTLKDLVMEDRMPGQTASIMYRASLQREMSPEQRRAYQHIRYCVGDRRRTLLILLNGPVFCLNRELSAYRYVVSHGSSWNARTHGKNLAGRYYIQEKDFRKFALEQYGIHLKNNYVLVGTGVMAVLRFFLKPSKENREQLFLILNEYRNPVCFFWQMALLFPGAFFTLIVRTIKKVLEK